VTHGGRLAGIVAACRQALMFIDDDTIVVPGHGEIADKRTLAAYADELEKINESIERMVRKGMTLEEIQKAKPAAEMDALWGQGFMKTDYFVELTYMGIKKYAR
jgi:glyoxylase-like metal-dependent hydrolase (beta-lactamase superfamily II)